MPDEQLSGVDALVRLSFLVAGMMEARASSEDLSVQQIRLLGILRDREPTINELAAHLGVDKSSMSGAVMRAERRGLVARFPDPEDGRSVRVRLSPTGRALVSAAGDEFRADADRFLSRLPKSDRLIWVTLTTQLLAGEGGTAAKSPR